LTEVQVRIGPPIPTWLSYLKACRSWALLAPNQGWEEAEHSLHHLRVIDSVVDGLALLVRESTLSLLFFSCDDQRSLHITHREKMIHRSLPTLISKHFPEAKSTLSCCHLSKSTYFALK
jgi:hypothetical protein